MIFYKLSAVHKKWFILNQALIFVLLVVALIIAWTVTDVEMPNNGARLLGGASFIMTVIFFSLAILNRIGNLFKIKSMGFVFVFVMLLGFKFVIDPVVWTVGLLTIPLLIDDIIFRPIWLNIWYNQYDQVVVVR